jgi:hypothetical protein
MLALAVLSCPGSRPEAAVVETRRGTPQDDRGPGFAPPPPASLHDDDWDAPLS